ncbi:hypothetical protein [Streptomyces sp. NPDC050704]|uniref:hypothetical protein n=1 Tax=Streptomyces sp. NPDC050704 TaxID=3157219 RepID=UPI0034459849
MWTGVAGILAGGLLIFGQILTWRTPDTEDDDAIREVVTFYSKDGNQALAETGALVLLAAGLAFLCFLPVLVRAAGSRSTVALAGGTVFVVLLMVSAIAGNIYGITANHSEVFRVVPETALIAILLLDVAYGGLIGAMVGAAVLLLAVWRATRTTGDTQGAPVLPSWLTWAALVVGVLCLAGPFSAWLTPMLLAVWLVAAGLVVMLKRL